MNSFNMMIAVNAALNTSSISRLRDLWDSIDDKTLNIRRVLLCVDQSHSIRKLMQH